MKALWIGALVASSIAIGFIACNPQAVGRPCINPAGVEVAGTQVSSPALECPSRLCLLTHNTTGDTMQGGGADGGTSSTRATCTAKCESNDDCDAETKQYCKSGFVCAVASPTGNFACQRVCVCREDLDPSFNQDVDGGVVKPCACKPTEKENPTCSCTSNAECSNGHQCVNSKCQ